jgi:hypothetical protein
VSVVTLNHLAYLVGVPEFRVSYLNSGTLNGVDVFGCNFGAAAATTLVQITHRSWHAFGSVSGSIRLLKVKQHGPLAV